jgi:hypothetical protein
MTLESQYKEYLKDNPYSTYSFDEWKENIFHPMLEKLVIISNDYNKKIKNWADTEDDEN